MSDTQNQPTTTLRRYHFNLGNSTTGPIGYCADVVADSAQAAVAKLTTAIGFKDDQAEVDHDTFSRQEYITVFFNCTNITIDDIDAEDDAYCDINDCDELATHIDDKGACRCNTHPKGIQCVGCGATFSLKTLDAHTKCPGDLNPHLN
jgi:hypothetical protein